MSANTTELGKRLWGAADEFLANSKLKSSEYSVPVLGLIWQNADQNIHCGGTKALHRSRQAPGEATTTPCRVGGECGREHGVLFVGDL
jgi:hypothetical protein